MKVIDLTGQKFGRLTVLRRSKNKSNRRESNWLCKCDCGGVIIVVSDSLH